MENKVKLKRVKHSTDEERYIEACKVVGYTYDEVAQRCFRASQASIRFLELLRRVVEVAPTWLRDSLTEEEWEELQRLIVGERDCDKDSLI